MIRKICVAMYIHTLKHGALASKGHAVAVPQDMKIFTKLPLLPNEIGILLLKSGNINSKKYLASRSAIEDALQALVFGVPECGVSQPLNNYHLYYGNDHCSGTQLKGKYFLYLPNSYYWDVTINESRLNMLPRVPSPVQLPTIKIHDDPKFQGEDNGPSKHQFDTLHENEEIVSYDELKKLLKTFLGNDADNWQDVINEGRIAEITFNNKSNEKV